jgi:hypothetical protein
LARLRHARQRETLVGENRRGSAPGYARPSGNIAGVTLRREIRSRRRLPFGSHRDAYIIADGDDVSMAA